MFDIGGMELLLIIIAILVFFGPKKLPELMQSMGRGMREFKKAQREFTQHINTAFEEEQRKSSRAAATPSYPSETVARGTSPVVQSELPTQPAPAESTPAESAPTQPEPTIPTDTSDTIPHTIPSPSRNGTTPENGGTSAAA